MSVIKLQNRGYIDGYFFLQDICNSSRLYYIYIYIYTRLVDIYIDKYGNITRMT
jgi:hypothetical protein